MKHTIALLTLLLAVPAAFGLWCLCRISSQCSRDEEKRGEQ